MGKNGGARPGSGAKKGKPMKPTIDRAIMRDAMLKVYAARMEEMFKAQIESAKGVLALREDGRVYSIPPNTAAWKNITDHVLGRAQEFVDLTTLGEKLEGVQFYLPKKDESSQA